MKPPTLEEIILKIEQFREKTRLNLNQKPCELGCLQEEGCQI